MSPLGQQIADWLRRAPGALRADSEEKLWVGLHSMSGIKCSRQDFKDALDRAGYKPMQRMNHGTREIYWLMGLPEVGHG